MTAKCPHCESGCPKCNKGFFDVGFAKGTIFTRHCNACGEDNGGRICDEEPEGRPEDCVFCDSSDIIWLAVGISQ